MLFVALDHRKGFPHVGHITTLWDSHPFWGWYWQFWDSRHIFCIPGSSGSWSPHFQLPDLATSFTIYEKHPKTWLLCPWKLMLSQRSQLRCFPQNNRRIVRRCTASQAPFPRATPHYWLVVGPPLWKIWVSQLGWLATQYMEIWKSIGMMRFPTEWENKKWQPNHQPDYKWKHLIFQLAAVKWVRIVSVNPLFSLRGETGRIYIPLIIAAWLFHPIRKILVIGILLWDKQDETSKIVKNNIETIDILRWSLNHWQHQIIGK